MEKKKIYKTVVKITVLTEEPLECSSLYPLDALVRDCMENIHLHEFNLLEDNKILTGRTAKNALRKLK